MEGRVSRENSIQLGHDEEPAKENLRIDDSSMDKLNKRKQKHGIEESKNCFRLHARDLSITRGEDGRYWSWANLKVESDVFVEVAELIDVCRLDVRGKFQTKKLSPGITYEVAFVVLIRRQAYGWETPVTVRLALPNGIDTQERVDLRRKSHGKWIEIPAGKFRNEGAGEIEFSMYEHGAQWKRGLVVKGVVIRPSS